MQSQARPNGSMDPTDPTDPTDSHGLHGLHGPHTDSARTLPRTLRTHGLHGLLTDSSWIWTIAQWQQQQKWTYQSHPKPMFKFTKFKGIPCYTDSIQNQTLGHIRTQFHGRSFEAQKDMEIV